MVLSKRAMRSRPRRIVQCWQFATGFRTQAITRSEVAVVEVLLFNSLVTGVVRIRGGEGEIQLLAPLPRCVSERMDGEVSGKRVKPRPARRIKVENVGSVLEHITQEAEGKVGEEKEERIAHSGEVLVNTGDNVGKAEAQATKQALPLARTRWQRTARPAIWTNNHKQSR